MNSLHPYSPNYQLSHVEELALSLKNAPQELVCREESRYNGVISQIADYIHTHNISLLLIAGPSASGKTTTSKRLEAALLARSHRVYRISLDNFYRESDTLPHWEDGSPNFETPDSLDIPYYQSKMQQLFHQGEQEFSVFDFKTNTRGKETFTVKYDANTCLILEGIHALNPKLMPNDSFSAWRVYISPHTQFLYQNHILLTARQLRLTRRILRDTALRGTTGTNLKNVGSGAPGGTGISTPLPQHGRRSHQHHPSVRAFSVRPSLFKADGPIRPFLGGLSKNPAGAARNENSV